MRKCRRNISEESETKTGEFFYIQNYIIKAAKLITDCYAVIITPNKKEEPATQH